MIERVDRPYSGEAKNSEIFEALLKTVETGDAVVLPWTSESSARSIISRRFRKSFHAHVSKNGTRYIGWLTRKEAVDESSEKL